MEWVANQNPLFFFIDSSHFFVYSQRKHNSLIHPSRCSRPVEAKQNQVCGEGDNSYIIFIRLFTPLCDWDTTLDWTWLYVMSLSNTHFVHTLWPRRQFSLYTYERSTAFTLNGTLFCRLMMSPFPVAVRHWIVRVAHCLVWCEPKEDRQWGRGGVVVDCVVGMRGIWTVFVLAELRSWFYELFDIFFVVTRH